MAGAPGDGPVVHFDQKATLGYLRGQVVEYLDFGPVKLRAGNKKGSARILRSAAAIRQAVARGELTLQRPGIVGPQDLTPVTSWA